MKTMAALLPAVGVRTAPCRMGPHVRALRQSRGRTSHHGWAGILCSVRVIQVITASGVGCWTGTPPRTVLAISSRWRCLSYGKRFRQPWRLVAVDHRPIGYRGHWGVAGEPVDRSGSASTFCQVKLPPLEAVGVHAPHVDESALQPVGDFQEVRSNWGTKFRAGRTYLPLGQAVAWTPVGPAGQTMTA
jgi:hypothetical protein